MTDTATPTPTLPPRWVIRLAWRIHRGLYRLSGGRFGLRRPKGDTYGLARLTTVGRRSGRDRSVMVAYFEHERGLVTLAMNGWGAPEPAWWLNLQARPEAVVDLGQGPRPVRARAAEGAERDELWAWWAETEHRLDGWASLRPTETAVVVLEPLAA